MLFSISFNQSHRSSLSHNNRENIHGNPRIDPFRLQENIYFVKKDIRDIYKDVFQEAVNKYNEKQKRKDRKIKDYYDKVKKDTKTHEQRELVIAIGEGNDDSKHRKVKKEVLKRYAETFQERNPNLAVYNMVLHDDEANPHVHINYVPNFESSRGLTRRVGMDRALQQQGIEGKSIELLANWRALETAYIETLAKEKIPEFERANVGSHKYMKVRQFKEYAETKLIVENQVQEKEIELGIINNQVKNVEEKTEELQIVKKHIESDVVNIYKELKTVKQQVDSEQEKLQLINEQYREIEKKVKQKEKEWNNRMNQLPNEEITIPFLRKEIVIDVQDKLFGKADVKKKQTKNYVLSPEQYQEVTEQMNAAVIIKKEYKRLKQTDFVQENESLRMHAKHYMKENSELKQEKNQFKKEVGLLNTEISSLKAHIKDLQTNIKVLYQQIKKVFKGQFKALRELVKNELDRKGVENQFEREHTKEIKKHRGFDRER